jgi:hypothetical protein
MSEETEQAKFMKEFAHRLKTPMTLEEKIEYMQLKKEAEERKNDLPTRGKV